MQKPFRALTPNLDGPSTGILVDCDVCGPDDSDDEAEEAGVDASPLSMTGVGLGKREPCCFVHETISASRS